MTQDEKLDAIQSSDIVRGIDSRFFDEVAVRAGELIAVEGALCHQLILVIDGQLETRSGGCVGVIGQGDACGWQAMERRGANEATVIARTDARLLVMSHAQFRAASGPPPKSHFRGWALPSSRRSLPRPANLSGA